LDQVRSYRFSPKVYVIIATLIDVTNFYLPRGARAMELDSLDRKQHNDSFSPNVARSTFVFSHSPTCSLCEGTVARFPSPKIGNSLGPIRKGRASERWGVRKHLTFCSHKSLPTDIWRSPFRKSIQESTSQASWRLLTPPPDS
jgi:hypothetical protein